MKMVLMLRVPGPGSRCNIIFVCGCIQLNHLITAILEVIVEIKSMLFNTQLREGGGRRVEMET